METPGKLHGNHMELDGTFMELHGTSMELAGTFMKLHGNSMEPPCSPAIWCINLGELCDFC